MKKTAVIVAGGAGARMQSDRPKQFLPLLGTPILIHTIRAFESAFSDIRLIIVLPASHFEEGKKIVASHIKSTIDFVEGGATRFHSVKNGLDKIDNTSVVAIHDGVRPLISTALINNLVGETKSGRGVIPIIPVKNSIRKIEGENSVHIDRSNLYKVQTPQCFLSADIKEAYTQDFSATFTDDASVFEANGGKINTLFGEERNLKITTQQDLNIAEIL